MSQESAMTDPDDSVARLWEKPLTDVDRAKLRDRTRSLETILKYTILVCAAVAVVVYYVEPGVIVLALVAPAFFLFVAWKIRWETGRLLRANKKRIVRGKVTKTWSQSTKDTTASGNESRELPKRYYYMTVGFDQFSLSFEEYVRYKVGQLLEVEYVEFKLIGKGERMILDAKILKDV